MEIIAQLTSLLPIEAPFYIDRVEKDEEKGEVHIFIGVLKDYRPDKDCGIHSYYERSWEHLKLFQYRSFLHCRVPVFEHKKSKERKALEIPFSRKDSRFTLLYEAEVMRLMQLHHCYATVARQLGIYAQRVESVYHYYTTSAFNEFVTLPCQQVGLDETSTRKGHDYISLFVNMKTHKIIHIEDGKDASVLNRFLQAHPNPTCIKDVSMDMSPAFIKGKTEHLPWASITFDKWHVLKLVSKYLKDLSAKHKVIRPYVTAIHQLFTTFYQQTSRENARGQLAFIADFIEELIGRNPLSKSLRKHFEGITEYFRSKLTNGVLEGINSKIQTIKRVARGFRHKENFKKMILFVFGDLNLPLPSKII